VLEERGLSRDLKVAYDPEADALVIKAGMTGLLGEA